jgi:hypothetical protein
MRGTINFRVACTVADHSIAGKFNDEVIKAMQSIAEAHEVHFDHLSARYFIEVEQDFGVQ